MRSVEVAGGEPYSRDHVLRFARVAVGEPLGRTPAAIAETLEMRYRSVGFPAIHVEVAFDAASGALRIAIDPGRLLAVEVDGLTGKAQARAVSLAALVPGEVVREQDVQAALERLERGSGGVYERAGEYPYFRLARERDGVRLTLQVHAHGHEFSMRPGGPGTAPFMNRVDGFAPWLSGRLRLFDAGRLRHTEIDAGGSWGFAAKELRYVIGVRHDLLTESRLIVGYEYHDLTDSDDVFRPSTFEPSGSLLSWPFSMDQFRRHGHEAYAFWRPRPEALLGLTYRQDRHESLPVTSDGRIFGGDTPRPNPPVEEGLMRSIIVSARLAHGGAIVPEERHDPLALPLRSLFGVRFGEERGLQADATLEASLPGDGEPGFDFVRAILQLRGVHAVSPRVSLRLRAIGGTSAGELPPQKRFVLGGLGTLRGHETRDYAGEAMVFGSMDWVWAPLAGWPALCAFYDGGAVSGSGADEDWRSDVGFGLEWPPGPSALLRLEVATPIGPRPDERTWRASFRLRIPL